MGNNHGFGHGDSPEDESDALPGDCLAPAASLKTRRMAYNAA